MARPREHERIRGEAKQRDLPAAFCGSVQSCDELSEQMLWATHGPAIWRARRFRGAPEFYPVYRCGDLYSHSPLPLILHKRSLRVDRRSARRAEQPEFLYASGRRTIDREIVRIGGPPWPHPAIRSAAVYAQQIAAAMRDDIGAAEARHPGYTNVVLCGGRDSLNLLLLPWKNPVLVASAPPNHELVTAFVRAHGLGREVVRLDDDESLLPLEILVNCCRNNLEHCRWGPALRRLSLALDGRVMFWKGQLGDTFLTPRWTRWCHPPYAVDDALRALCRPLGGRGERRLHRLLEAGTVTQRIVFWSLWHRGAMWQGAHMSILRQLTDALVLSGYHGPAVRRVVARVDLHHAVRQDVRPLVGEILYGRPVQYPETNPCPPLSRQRRGASGLAPFVRELTAAGVAVQA